MSTTARHANFACVTTVTADFANGMLAAAASLVPSPSFSLPNLVMVGADSIGLSGSLTVLTPTVSFASNSANLIGVSVGASGLVRLTANGTDLIEVELTLTTSLEVGVLVDVSPTALALRPDLSHASVTAIGVQVEFGPPLVTVYQAAIQDPSVLAAFSAGLQAIPQQLVTFNVPGATGTFNVNIGPLNVPFPFSRVLAVPLDGNVLNIAADVSPYTTGDPSLLVNLITARTIVPVAFVFDQFGNETEQSNGVLSSYGISIAAVVNVAFLNAVLSGPVSSQLPGVNIQGVTLSSLSLSAGQVQSVIGQSDLPTGIFYNSLTMNGSGTYHTAVSVGFSFSVSITAVLIEEWTQSFPDFEVVSYSYPSGILSVIEGLAGVLTFGIGGLIISSTVASVIGNTVSSVGSSSIPTGGVQPIPGIPNWTITYNVECVVVQEADVGAPEVDMFASATVNGPPSLPMPSPDFALSQVPHDLKDLSPIVVNMYVSDSTLFDPLLGLRISWLATRADTGATMLTQDTLLTTAALTISLDRATGDLIYNDIWDVTCEIYRPGDALTPRYSYTIQQGGFGVTDVVDRHHPYVRWDHVAYFHNPAGPPPLKSHELWDRSRHSRIHRTDLFTRCEVVDGALSPQAPAVQKGMTPVYLDTLAPYGTFASVAGVPRKDSWRAGVLCDYCFFGGPTRTVWKPPTPPTPDWV